MKILQKLILIGWLLYGVQAIAQKLEAIDHSLFPVMPLGSFLFSDLDFPKEAQSITDLTSPKMALYKPEGAGPFPAVVFSPTCGGVGGHLIQWVRAAVARGYAALVLDHMTQRKTGNICGSRSDLTFWRGTKDAYDALDYLSTFDFIDIKKVGLVGYSWGGAVAYFLASKSISVENLVKSKRDLRYAATVGVYPVCFHAAFNRGNFLIPAMAFMKPDIDRPVLALMGELDHEEPTVQCTKMLSNMKNNGQPVEWWVYPQTSHAWDNKLVDGKKGRVAWMDAGGVFKYDETVTNDSMLRTFDFLRKNFQGN